MSGQAAILISFIIYLTFFGWLGWRRGARREITVFTVALITGILLQEQGEIVVNMANLFGAAMVFAREGGFGGSQEEAFEALTGAPEVVSSDGEQSFLFVVWVVIFIITYAFSNNMIQDSDSESNGWAMLFGVLNGLFFAVAFVPSLLALFAGDEVLAEGEAAVDFFALIGGGAELIWGGLNSVWSVIESSGSLGLLTLLTALLVLAATSIRGGKKQGDKEKAKS